MTERLTLIQLWVMGALALLGAGALLYVIHFDATISNANAPESAVSSQTVRLERTATAQVTTPTPSKHNLPGSDVAKANQANAEQGLVKITPLEWRVDGPLAGQLASLVAMSESGDSAASYRLGMNLRRCYYAPENDVAYELKLAELNSFSDADRAIEQETARYEFCRGVSAEQKREFFHYLDRAAKEGVVFAQEAIGVIPQDFYMKSQGLRTLPREEYIAKRDAFLAKQQAYLHSAASHGSINAMQKLAHINAVQQTGPHGRLRAYAYNRLILDYVEDNDLYNRYQHFQQTMQGEFSANEVLQAEQLYEQWRAEVASNGTLYLGD